MKNQLLLLAVSALFLFRCAPKPEGPWLVNAPAGERLTQIDRAGETVLPNGRLITPYGQTIMVAPHPFGLVLSPDGDAAITANSGTSPLSISIIRGLQSGNPQVQQIPEGARTDKGVLGAVFMGLAVSPDNQVVYVAGGQENCIYRFRLADGAKLDSISCSQKNDTVDFTHGYIGDMVLSRDGRRLYAVDQINFRMIVVDAEQKKLLANVPVGRYPFGITLSPDEKTAYVANVGMYEYSWLPSFDKQKPEATALDFPPFAYLSEESIRGIRTDSFSVPGLGDPNGPESFSVWAVDLEQNKVAAKVKTGILVGEKIEDIPAVGGASPNSVVATDKYVFVSNGNNDCISVISTETDTVAHTIWLRPDGRLGNLRGVIPFGLALSPDGRRLYVAEAGINAVAVIDVGSLEVKGHIPAGWFPSKLKVTPDGKKLVVANAKGFGSGPNGGSTFEPGPEGSYIGGLMKGSVCVMDVPTDKELKKLTQKVLDNNFAFENAAAAAARRPAGHPIPVYPGERQSPIRHIVFISKENRTYDEVFGQLQKGRGEAALARYGYHASFRNQAGARSLDSVTVMPNHLAMAERFAMADNFYVDSDVSADGHRWLACTYPNEWVESSVAAAYGGNRSMRWDSKAPGNLAFEGASGAIYPEDYNEAGSLWDHLARHKVGFYNFGCGLMFAPHLSDDLAYKGYGYAINYPVTQALYENSSKRFPTYNMAIPDQYRVDQFEQEFKEKWLSGKDTMPPMVTIIISNDHGAGERPEAGFPFRESYMADNDLALGRIVEFLSRTPYWKSMAIVVTEDDAQGGVDHIDAHRSLLMVISPYANKGQVATTHYSFGSIFKTFWHILGIPYLNQYDAGATDMGALFSATPDFTPYQAITPDPRLFDPEKAYGPLHEAFDWQSLQQGPAMDDVEYIQENWE